MSIKDILLTLTGEPNAAAVAAIAKCTAAARDMGARISAVAIEEDIPVRPKVTVLDAGGEPEAVRFVSNARGLLQAFDASVSNLGIRNEQRLIRLPENEIPSNFAFLARLKDVSFVMVRPNDDRSKYLVEALLFESGRPVLMCPEEFAAQLPVAFDDVVIAWDHTAPAARAISDAMPVLQAAATVRIITATDRNTPAEWESGTALVNHLAEHGIEAGFETVKIDGISVGKVFEAYVRAKSADLLVMGGYRHSRLNQAIWGGATKTIIERPPCWVMMSR